MSLVKICGINSETAFEVSVEAGADYLGFVFFTRSPRVVTIRQAAALSGRHKGGPKRVGLFVLPTREIIQQVLEAMHLDILQIYGDAAMAQTMGEVFNLPVWRPVGVKSAADLPTQKAAEAGLIIESAPPEAATRPGGNATAFDWTLLKGWTAPAPWLLAGGLNAANVAKAITLSGAPGVDVSSGVESLPGVKSPVLIRRFIANARMAGAPVIERNVQHRA